MKRPAKRPDLKYSPGPIVIARHYPDEDALEFVALREHRGELLGLWDTLVRLGYPGLTWNDGPAGSTLTIRLSDQSTGKVD